MGARNHKTYIWNLISNTGVSFHSVVGASLFVQFHSETSEKDLHKMQVWAIVHSRNGEIDDDNINKQLNQIRGFAYENGDGVEFFLDLYKFSTIEVLRRIVNSGIERVYITDITRLLPNFDSRIAFLASCNALKIEVVSAYERELHFESAIEKFVRARLRASDGHSRKRRAGTN